MPNCRASVNNPQDLVCSLLTPCLWLQYGFICASSESVCWVHLGNGAAVDSLSVFFILHQLLLHTLTKSDQITINNLQYSLCPVTNIFLAQFCEFCALAAEPWWNWMRLWIPCLGALQLGCLVQVLLKDVSRLAGYDF